VEEEIDPAVMLRSLLGEVIVGGSATEDGVHLLTQSGLLIIVIGGLGIVKTEEVQLH
jgi:hypothetical protein